jgi:hypothetical protein
MKKLLLFFAVAGLCFACTPKKASDAAPKDDSCKKVCCDSLKADSAKACCADSVKAVCHDEKVEAVAE